MQLYAEYAYYDEVSEEHLRDRFSLCTGFDMDAFLALEIDDYPPEWRHDDALNVSKQVLYQDLLLGLFDKNFSGLDLAGHYRKKAAALRNIKTPSGLEELFDYHKQLLAVLVQKCDMGLRIAHAYKSGDKAALRLLTEDLRRLYSEVGDLHTKFSALWHKTNKPFGFERADLRFGGLLARIKTAEKKLSDYVNGSLSFVEELEAERLMFGGDEVKPGKSLLDCQYYDEISVPAAVI